MTPEQWHNHASFRKELDDLLSHPTFKIALEIVKDHGNKPINLMAMPPGVTLTEWYASMGAKREGYFEALINLRSLTQFTAPKVPGVKPWETQPEPEKPTS